MIIIDTTTQSIAMTRGDYAALVFCAYEDDGVTLFDLSEGDVVQLQVGKKYGDPIRTWTKIKDNSLSTTATDYTIEIQPEDTKEFKFGEYYFDVSILFANGTVCTYIGDTGDNQPKFTILKEVGSDDD